MSAVQDVCSVKFVYSCQICLTMARNLAFLINSKILFHLILFVSEFNVFR